MANHVQIVADAKDNVSSTLDKIKDKFNLLGKSAAGQGIIMGAASAATAAGLGLVQNALGNVVGWLGDSAKAYQDDEASVTRLTTSLKDNVAGWNGSTDAIEKSISARMKLGFSDEEQRNALAGLLAITHDQTKALADEAIAMDLARLKGLDLGTASELIGKVAGGNIGILSRYGIVVQKGATAEQALAQISKLAAGQADAYANTLGGKLAAAQVQAQEAQEKFGKSLTELEAVVLPPLADALGVVADAFATIDTRATKSMDDTAAAAARGSQSAGAALNEMRAKAEKATTALDSTASHAGKMADDVSLAMADVKDAAKSTFPTLDDLKKKFQDAASASSELDGYINDLAGTLFGLTSKKGEVAQAAKDLADLVKAGPSSKDSQDIDIWNGKVADAKSKLLELQGQLALSEGPAAFAAWLDTLQTKLGLTNGQVNDLIKLIKGTAQASGNLPDLLTGYAGKKTKGVLAHRAGGGPVDPSNLYIVGENGPELFRPRTAGTIVPNGAMPTAKATTAQPSEVHYHYEVTVQGNLIAETKQDVLNTLRRLTAIQAAGNAAKLVTSPV